MPRLLSNYSNKGFVLSSDALIAVFLVVTFMGTAILVQRIPSSVVPTATLSRMSHDSLVSLDENGILFSITDANATQEELLAELDNHFRAALPTGTHYRFQLSRFDYNSATCKLEQTFEDCFQNETTFPAQGETLPTDKTVVTEQKTLFRKGTDSYCSIGSVASLAETPSFSSNLAWLSETEPWKRFWFSAATDANLEFTAVVTPSGTIQCDEDVRVDLNVSVLPAGRKPVDVALVLDRSGSMSWDGIVDTTDARESLVQGNTLFLADASGGLRTIDVTNPRLPSLIDVYNTPGTTTDVALDSEGFAYIADTSGGFRIFNVQDPNDIQFVSSLTTITNVNGVEVNNNLAFLAVDNANPLYDVTTTTSSNSDLYIGYNAPIYDVTTTTSTSQNVDVRIGYSANESWVGQSLVANSTLVAGVELRLRRTGNPDNLTVHIRSSIDGADIGSGTIAASAIGTSYGWYRIDFSSSVTLVTGNTYYIVLTTTSESTSNYYRWASKTNNPYGDGQAYQQTSPISGSDMLLRTYYYQLSAGQSFVSSFGTLPTVQLYLRRVGSPGYLTLHLRSSIDGADLASVSVAPSAIGTSYGWTTINFVSPLSITPGTHYYLVLTTAGQSTSNYYNWGQNSTNPYASGQAFIQSTAQNSDALLRTSVSEGLHIVDISNRNNPFLIGTAFAVIPQDIEVVGNRAYLADGSAGLRIFDITTPSNPTQLGWVDTTNAFRLAVSGNYAFIADAGSGIRVISIADPANPSIVYTYDTPGLAYDVAIQNNFLYVADGSSLLELDISNPLLPALSRSFSTSYTYRGLSVSATTAFMASGSQGIITISLLDGVRIDQSKAAGSVLLASNLWKSGDQIALASFSSGSGSPTLDHALTSNRTDINTALYALVAQGGTNIESGIRAAMPELTDTLVITTQRNSYLRVGYSSSETTAAQSFLQVKDRSITGVKLLLQKFGNPSDLTISLRTGIGSGDLGTVTLTASSISTGSFAWYTATFSSSYPLSDQSTYYIVLSKSGGNSTSNYYQWGRQSSGNPYYYGDAYQQSSFAGGDMGLQIQYLSGLQNPNSQKFAILMSDGQSNYGNSLAAAQDANVLGITIFTVAFGADADEAELQSIADATDGESYTATDVNSLADFYLLIAEQIGQIAAGGSFQIVEDANLVIPIPPGTTITDDGGSEPLTVGDQNYLLFTIGDLNSNVITWSGYYIFQYNCDSNYACVDENRVVPSDGTIFEWRDENGTVQDPLPWDSNTSIFVKYRDLTLTVFGADIIPSGVWLDLNAINAGYLSSNPTQLEILVDNPITGSVLATLAVNDFACGYKEPACMLFNQVFFDAEASESGQLFAVINRNRAIPECPQNNVIPINCTSTESEYWTITLWVWRT